MLNLEKLYITDREEIGEDSEVIGLRQAGKLRLENIQWDELEQGEQQRRVHHLGTGKGEAEYGKLIPQGTSYQ